MLFAWMGFLAPDDDTVPQTVQQQSSDFLGQPFIDIRYVGPLRDAEGKRAGMLMIFEIKDRAKAETFVNTSPYYTAGLYRDFRLYEYQNEV